MTDKPDVFAELSAALDVQPSPEFAARVRSQLAEAPRASWSWRWAMVPAAVLVAAVTTMFVVARHPTVVTQAPIEKPSVASIEPAPPVAVAPPQAPAFGRGVSVPHVVVASAPTASRPAEPEVLVPADERIALNRLLVALRQGRVTVPAPGNVVAEDAEGRMLEPAPVEIPSIKVESLPASPADRSGGRFPWF